MLFYDLDLGAWVRTPGSTSPASMTPVLTIGSTFHIAVQFCRGAEIDNPESVSWVAGIKAAGDFHGAAIASNTSPTEGESGVEFVMDLTTDEAKVYFVTNPLADTQSAVFQVKFGSGSDIQITCPLPVVIQNNYLEDEFGAVAPPINTVAPVLSGLPYLGQTITCDGGTFTGGGITKTYQHKLEGVELTGQTEATLAVSEAAPDHGDILTCDVTATNSAGEVTVSSNSLTVVLAPVFTTAPTVTGPDTPGATLTRTLGACSHGGALGGQWVKNTTPTGSSAATYSSTVDGDVVFWAGTATNAAGSDAEDSNTITVAAEEGPTSVSPPIVTYDIGSDQMEGTDGVFSDTPDSVSYRWTRNGVDYGTASSILNASSLDYSDELILYVTGLFGAIEVEHASDSFTFLDEDLPADGPMILFAFDIAEGNEDRQHRIKRYLDDELLETIELAVGVNSYDFEVEEYDTLYTFVQNAFEGEYNGDELTADVWSPIQYAPSGFTAETGDEGENDLEWTNTSAGETEIYTRVSGVGSYSLLETAASGVTTYTHTGISGPYDYKLRHVRDNDGYTDSSYSPYTSVETATAGTDTSAPTLTSRTIGADGTTLTLVGSEAMYVGAGGNGGFNVDASIGGANVTATYVSGSGTNTLVYTLGTVINGGETCDLDYTQPGNGIEDVAGNDLASITSATIINSSMVGVFPMLDYEPLLWLKASDASTLFDAVSGGSLVAPDGAVARWEDKSGNGFHFTQATAGDRPIRKVGVINGLDAVRFSLGDLLLRSCISAATEFTIIVVKKYDTTANDYGLSFYNGNGSSNGYGLMTIGGDRGILFSGVAAVDGSPATTNAEVWTARRAGTNVFLSVNGVAETLSASSSACATPTDSTYLSATLFVGYMMEVVFFPSSIDSGDLSDIEAALIAEYGL